MRTTLQIDDDVFQAVRSIARAENRPIGVVISELARRALAPQPVRRSRGFPTFRVPRDGAPITPEVVKRADEGECWSLFSTSTY